MEKQLRNLIKENTKNEQYENNHALYLGKVLGFSRNWISSHLNDLYNNGSFIKINSRPVLFLDKEVLEERYKKPIPKNLYNSLEDLNHSMKNKEEDFQTLIGYDGSLRSVVETCKASLSYPPNGLPTLLYGPTGTGKSLIVKKMYEYGIHHHIFKSDSQYVHVNCSEYANNPELLTAYLFGYKKGAFTGADHDNPGLIQQANGGVLFLDEVHCLKPECQEKLFLFMDNGTYRQIGDNEHLYTSKVFLAFATTENPKDALLKTLLRRIPIQISIPSLEQRGEKEKSRLIVSLLENESKQIHKEIKITSSCYHTLLNTTYEGNVGELKNILKQTCMNALFSSENKNCITINNLHLPHSLSITSGTIMIVEHENFTLEQLKQKSANELGYNIIKNIQKWTLRLQNNEILLDEYFDKIYVLVSQYINSILFSDQKAMYASNLGIVEAIKSIIEMVNQKYRCNLKDKEINAICMFYLDYFSNRSEASKVDIEEYDVFISLIKKQYVKETQILSSINDLVHLHLNIKMNDFFQSCLALYLSRIWNEVLQKQRIGIIIAHGYATASSIASSVNKMLDTYVFDALDMPLDTTTDRILDKLNAFIKNCMNIKDLVLLVDMGSLEDIYNDLKPNDFNIAIANNVSTKFALYVGQGMIQNQSLKQIFDQSIENINISYKIAERKEKEKIILCSCATGLGTAEKLKEILEDSLPEKLSVKVLTYDYSTLVKNHLGSEFFERYEVLCIVGTLNPNIPGLQFVSIEDLIVNESFGFLTDYFEGLLSKEDMDQFQKNLLKNFSLTNIIMNLTFLNPNKLLEHVADSIDVLQTLLNTTFTNNMCFGLYVHICCLIERLVSRDGIDSYIKTLDECSLEFQDFYFNLKSAFQKVEKYYRIQIPIEEVEYIYIYIQNMKETSKNEDDE
ncbi:MAG: sigma 54-interacting transcriptional regulator [Floccifex porci]|uniref:sigma 54-interacting transcriptional regulator n=1 Tax=Floccifex porci TaxID=2606629 RepID=UPI002A827F06|nr:sigma 54-interacting transcriptional regulator [Floccifex porci]MDY4796068.1 sigma 54-interacting transcriptional regulator [Floccifex porci]